MSEFKITVFHTGIVCVSPNLPFGGENCNIIKASGIFSKKSDRLWLPVSCYLIEHPIGKILVDTGWHRNISPNGKFDKRAQIKSLGSPLLYMTNQGMIENGMTIDEQLAQKGIKISDIDYLLLSHLDCDHVNGLNQVSNVKNILVAKDELEFAQHGGLTNRVRYQKKWWDGVEMRAFDWNGTEGPAAKSYDLFKDGSVVCINIPGHSDGMFAVKITNSKGQYVLLVSDGGYAKKSWEQTILPGIASDKKAQKKSLMWIQKMASSKNCIEVLANHDTELKPHEILF
ncbi:N-acyl homoserine lactonase family protein [Thomasclavelia ramosa]|uniref:N-acyl homoserine lactonase family protein n=1 Tax=Thomasclavelia ramosa TaxID=1547 RepID=UPI001D07921D|nr:N-acyl homoserine lactonase family protein [Thomasclavelia ramosa]MCB6435852.1 N-acyl homoserine lactonase family protein [Thomasclavelia ramosa]MCB6458901.1 N-acyl homoserine lactonase family protein [Thomasclavelia ramosa]MCB6597119.1 N-acyl homoserine lactonase family protein [Thomasclavelia ramosa]MCB6600622.1 N-acyl homoserine lactonase family protein [Thomasclavelia ramosa]MCB6618699.1 N-acyl homoserine lactonase family protein [Thomasclavelia ramosa]